MLRAGALPWSSAAARPAARGQLRGPLGTLLPPACRAVRRRAHSSAAPAPVLADAGASTSPDFVAAGFGARGAAVCEQLLNTRALPPLACWPLPGDTPAANAAAFKARACGSCVLVGNPAEASAPATVQLAQMLSDAGTSVCAVLASPFAFEGARKAAAAADVVNALRSCVELLVLVEQEQLFNSSAQSGITLTEATAAADGVLCGAVASLRCWFASQTRVLRSADGKTEAGGASFRADLARLMALSGQPAVARSPTHACFGTGSAAFTLGDSDTAAAAAVTAAAFSAAGTAFLSPVRASPALACICLIRAASPIPEAVLSAAGQALPALFAGCPLLLSSTVDATAEAQVHVDLLVLPRPTATAETAAPADTSAQQRKSWSAMTKLAAGTAEPRKPPPARDAKPAVAAARVDVAPAAPLPVVAAPTVKEVAAPPPPVVAAPPPPPVVAAPPPPPPPPVIAAPTPLPVAETPVVASAAGFDPVASEADTIQDTEDDAKQARSRVGALLKLFGLQKPPEQSISQRASAVLANDRAASRVVVRMTFPDGSSYEGEVQDGAPHGIGRRVYSNGSWYAGEWQKGQRQGWGVSQTGGDRYEGLWSQGVPTSDEP